MEFQERFEALSQIDIQKIKKTTKITLWAIAGVEVVFGAVVSTMIFNIDSILPVIFGIVFLSLPVGVAIYFYNTSQKDLISGQKKIIIGNIIEKFESTSRNMSGNSNTNTTYYFRVGNDKISVDNRTYLKYHENQPVEIELTIVSKTLISITNLDAQHSSPINSVSDIENKKPTSFPTFFENVKQVNLTADEYSYLTQKRNKRFVSSVILFSLIGFVAYWVGLLIIIGILLGLFDVKSPAAVQTAYWSYISVGLCLLLWLFYRRVMPLVKDVRDGQKNIVTTTITDKINSNVKMLNKYTRVTSSRGYFFYLEINNKLISVSSEIYYLFEGGEPINFHTGSNSKTPLQIESLVDKEKRFKLF